MAESLLTSLIWSGLFGHSSLVQSPAEYQPPFKGELQEQLRPIDGPVGGKKHLGSE
jgi:hypothetical protein